MNGLFNEVWEGKDVISLDHTLEITLAVRVYSSLQSWSDSPFSLILIFRLLSLSSVLQVIAIDCFLTECSQLQGLGNKCHGTRTKSYQRDAGCQWTKHSTSFVLALSSGFYSQIGFWNLRSSWILSGLLLRNYRYRFHILRTLIYSFSWTQSSIVYRRICLKWLMNGKIPM